MSDYEDTPEEIAEERITNLVRELDECKAKLAARSAPSDYTAEVEARLEDLEAAIREAFTLRVAIQRDAALPDAEAIRAALGEIEHFRTVHKRCHRIPTHGKCCTCQACGLDYDSCRLLSEWRRLL